MNPASTDTQLEASMPLVADELRSMDAYWRTCNDLALGRLYLCENPPLREPLRVAHIKKRLIGHWGSARGQNFVRVHWYKIANPTILGRISSDELDGIFARFGWTPHLIERDDPPVMHRKMATTVETCINQIRAVQQEARQRGNAIRPRWPMIILRTPKGWTAPKELDGQWPYMQERAGNT